MLSGWNVFDGLVLAFSVGFATVRMPHVATSCCHTLQHVAWRMAVCRMLHVATCCMLHATRTPLRLSGPPAAPCSDRSCGAPTGTVSFGMHCGPRRISIAQDIGWLCVGAELAAGDHQECEVCAGDPAPRTAAQGALGRPACAPGQCRALPRANAGLCLGPTPGFPPGQRRAVHANSALDHTRYCSGRGACVQVVRSIPQLHVIIHGLVKGFQSIMCGATRNVQYNVQARVELP